MISWGKFASRDHGWYDKWFLLVLQPVCSLAGSLTSQVDSQAIDETARAINEIIG